MIISLCFVLMLHCMITKLYIDVKDYNIDFSDVLICFMLVLLNAGRGFVRIWMFLLLYAYFLFLKRHQPLKYLLKRMLFHLMVMMIVLYMSLSLFEIAFDSYRFYYLTADVSLFQIAIGCSTAILLLLILWIDQRIPSPDMRRSFENALIFLGGTIRVNSFLTVKTAYYVSFIVFVIIFMMTVSSILSYRYHIKKEQGKTLYYKELLEAQKQYNAALINNRREIEKYHHQLINTISSLNAMLEEQAYGDMKQRLDADLAFLVESQNFLQTRYLLIDSILEAKKAAFEEHGLLFDINRRYFQLKDISESDIAIILYIMLSFDRKLDQLSCYLATINDTLYMKCIYRGHDLIPEAFYGIEKQITAILKNYQGTFLLEGNADCRDLAVMIPQI